MTIVSDATYIPDLAADATTTGPDTKPVPPPLFVGDVAARTPEGTLFLEWWIRGEGHRK